MKLSKAQRRVLIEMAEPGCVAHLTREFFCRATLMFERKGRRIHAENYRTLEELEALGLIKDTTDPAFRCQRSAYVITDAGRAAVEEA